MSASTWTSPPACIPNRDVSMKLDIEVSSVTGQATIGGIQQPDYQPTRKSTHEIRLKEGEVSVLAGLIETHRYENVERLAVACQTYPS